MADAEFLKNHDLAEWDFHPNKDRLERAVDGIKDGNLPVGLITACYARHCGQPDAINHLMLVQVMDDNLEDEELGRWPRHDRSDPDDFYETFAAVLDLCILEVERLRSDYLAWCDLRAAGADAATVQSAKDRARIRAQAVIPVFSHLMNGNPCYLAPSLERIDDQVQEDARALIDNGQTANLTGIFCFARACHEAQRTGRFFRGMLGAVALCNEAHGGVVRIEVWLVKADMLPLPANTPLVLAPWNRYWPDRATLNQERESIGNACEHCQLGRLGESEIAVVSHTRDFDVPIVADGNGNPAALPHHNFFTGDSLSLPILLALAAASKKRSVFAFATGEVGDPEQGAEGVGDVRQKCAHLRSYLNCPDHVTRANRAPRLLTVVVPGECEVEARCALPPEIQVLSSHTIAELCGSPRILFDPFDIDAPDRAPFADQLPEDGFAKEDEEHFFGSLPALAESLVKAWSNETEASDFEEVLLCTPFHVAANDASLVMNRAANELVHEITKLRRQITTDPKGPEPTTRVPVPVAVDLRDLPDKLLESKDVEQQRALWQQWLGERVTKYRADFFAVKEPDDDDLEALKNDVLTGLTQPNRFVLLLHDSKVVDTRLRLMTFDEDKSQRSSDLIGRVYEYVRNQQVHPWSPAPQYLLWISPNLHVQMFIEETLKARNAQFRREPFPHCFARP